MKKAKAKQSLFILTFFAVILLFSAPLNVSASTANAYKDAQTQVEAHIENTATEPTQATTAAIVPAAQSNSPVWSGDVIVCSVVSAVILLMLAVLAICFCKSIKSKHANNSDYPHY